MISIAITTAHITVGLLALAALFAAGWLALARLPNRAERRLAAARRMLERGDWQSALAEVRRTTPAPGAAPALWHEERRLLEGECLLAAGEAELRQNNFADAIARFREAAEFVNLTADQATQRVIEAMLAEARRLSFSDSKSPDLLLLLARIRKYQPNCPEAEFLAGLSFLRSGDTTQAIKTFVSAHALCQGRPGDASLYLGGLALRAGQPRDALRFFADANKSAPQCPIISWQMGTALAAAGGDALLAVRALQKATGPDGLPRFLADPNQLWIETFPPESWIRNLARQAAGRRAVYRCPLGFDDPKSALQSARRTLGEVLVEAQKPEDALRILQDVARTDDSPSVRRSLGMALVQLRRYDEALPHLQQAIALERPVNPRTASALAVSLANARGDRLANVRAALDLIGRHPARGDAVWARLAGSVIAAAQAANISVAPAQIVEIAGDLASGDAHDPAAAAVYDLLALRDIEATPFEVAGLYVRAAQLHGVCLGQDLALFQRAFRNRDALQRFFEAREWDFPGAERLYLERWAARSPGSFPESAGAVYAAESAAALLRESRRLAVQNQLDAAQASAELVLKLAPTSGAAHDRLAELAFRRGDSGQAIEWLTKWRALAPADPRPCARLALVHQATGQSAMAAAAAHDAMALARGPDRAPLALLAARIAVTAGQSDIALGLLNECLTYNAANPVALIARAALLWVRGEKTELAKMAGPLSELIVEDPWTHFLVAVSAFAAGDEKLAVARAECAARADGEAAAAGLHLLGLLRWQQRRAGEAGAILQKAAQRSSGGTLEHARAVLGQLAWHAGEYSDALKSWQAIPPSALKAWRLDAVIPGGAVLAGLRSLRSDRFDDAAKWFRAAARLHCPDPRLGGWLASACDRGGEPREDQDIARLQSAIEAAGPQPVLVQRLARLYRRAGRWAEARQCLESANGVDAGLHVERGLLALAERQLLPAERAFAEALMLAPDQPAATLNLLFVRLSLGRVADAAALVAKAVALAPTDATKKLSRNLQCLLSGDSSAATGWTPTDDEAMLEFIRSLGRWDSADALFDALTRLRGSSAVVRKAHAEMAVLRAKDMIDRGEAAALLRRYGSTGQSASAILRNLLGVAAALRQDFDSAIRHFAAALAQNDDGRVVQNLALVREWQDDWPEAALQWRHFLARQPPKVRVAAIPNYRRRLEALVRERLSQLEKKTGR